MFQFFRFPHTPHIQWLSEGAPRDDKVLSPAEVKALLSEEVMVEEKIDGANVGISLSAAGGLQVQNRGQMLVQPLRGQFSRLSGWLAEHDPGLRAVLSENLILFGEWCAAVHSMQYDLLPDWFLLFDVYDRGTEQFYSVSRRNQLAANAGLFVVPEIYRGRANLKQLIGMTKECTSAVGKDGLEGIVVRHDAGDWNAARGKLVRAHFVQAIEEHWSSTSLQWNKTILS